MDFRKKRGPDIWRWKAAVLRTETIVRSPPGAHSSHTPTSAAKGCNCLLTSTPLAQPLEQDGAGKLTGSGKGRQMPLPSSFFREKDCGPWAYL